MIDSYLQVLDSMETFPEKMTQIMEAFIDFYGEDKREEITNKFSNSVVIPYIPLSDLLVILINIKKEKTKELFQKLKDSTDFDEKEFDSIKSYGDFPDNLLLKYYKFVDEVRKTNNSEIRVPWDLASLDKEITCEHILEGNLSPLMEKMEKIRPIVESLEEEYNELYSKIEKYEQMTNIDTGKIEAKYLYDFACRHKELLGEEFEIIEENAKKGFIYMNSCPRLRYFLGSLNNPTNQLSSFDDESNEKLTTGTKYEKETIIKDRIEYYKLMGIDLGDDYEAYENSEECKKIKPTKEQIEYYKREKESYIKLYKKDILEHYPIYAKYKKMIDEIPFMEEVDLVTLFDEGYTAVSPNFVRQGDEIKSLPLVFLNLGREKEGLDANIIHEFNHLYELTELEVTDSEYHLICGWDLIDGDYKTVSEDLGKRKYEKLNEITNDIIAEFICRGMHEKGNYLVTSPGTARYNTAGYRRTTFLVADFFNQYAKKILESRKGDMSIITEHVGRDNFEALNELFPEFDDYFAGFKVLRWFQDHKEGKKTELTEKREEIERRRDEALERMIEYSNAQKKTI